MRGKKVKALRRAFIAENGRAPKDAEFFLLSRHRLVNKLGDKNHVGTMQVLKPAFSSERRALKRRSA